MKENCAVFDFELDEEDLMRMNNWHREENRNYNYPYLV
jgi:diketogulonate reductase-like aldo/keto reductase